MYLMQVKAGVGVSSTPFEFTWLISTCTRPFLLITGYMYMSQGATNSMKGKYSMLVFLVHVDSQGSRPFSMSNTCEGQQ